MSTVGWGWRGFLPILQPQRKAMGKEDQEEGREEEKKKEEEEWKGTKWLLTQEVGEWGHGGLMRRVMMKRGLLCVREGRGWGGEV